MNLYQKLQKCRVELQKKKIKKSGKNKYANFDYFELADFIPDVNVLFEENGLFSNFSIDTDKAYLTVINAEKPDEKEVFTSPIENLDLKGCNKIQALGGVHTYMRRYLYMNALEIVENDYFDGVTGKTQPAEQPQKETGFEEKIAQCKTVDELTALYNKFKTKLGKNDMSIFIGLSKLRKAEILKGEQNE